MKKRQFKINGNYIIANVIQQLNFGARRHVRFIKMFRSKVSLRVVWLLYKEGLLRSFVIKKTHILVYYKYHLGKNAFINLSIVSRPGRRCYWTLGFLSKKYNFKSFTGFYIISTNKGLVTSDYCLLNAHISGEVLIKVSL